MFPTGPMDEVSAISTTTNQLRCLDLRSNLLVDDIPIDYGDGDDDGPIDDLKNVFWRS